MNVLEPIGFIHYIDGSHEYHVIHEKSAYFGSNRYTKNGEHGNAIERWFDIDKNKSLGNKFRFKDSAVYEIT